MPQAPGGEITRILDAVRDGDHAARERLMTVVYEELHRIAAGQMDRERTRFSPPRW